MLYARSQWKHYLPWTGELYGIHLVVFPLVLNGYGPQQRTHLSVPRAVIPSFIECTTTDGTRVVHGTGEQTRNFVHVDDVAQAMVAAGTTPEDKGQTMNAANRQEVSVNEPVRKIERIAGCRLDVVRKTWTIERSARRWWMSFWLVLSLATIPTLTSVMAHG